MIYKNITEFIEKLEEDRPIIGLDIGTARIGIAVSDTRRVIASPREVYTRRNISKDLGHINKLATDENACAFVLGLPIDLQGNEEDNCLVVRNCAEKLIKKTALPIYLQDERMSTAAVTRSMQKSDMSRKKRQRVDDKLAASYILQIVLDMR